MFNVIRVRCDFNDIIKQMYKSKKNDNDPSLDIMYERNSIEFKNIRTNALLINIVEAYNKYMNNNTLYSIVAIPLIFKNYYSIHEKVNEFEFINIDIARFRHEKINLMLGSNYSDDVKLRIIARINNINIEIAKNLTEKELMDGSLEPTSAPPPPHMPQPKYVLLQ